ncbi:cytochrome oxidase maturation protein, cbb3-type [Thalassovita taeanensis]|jgi:cbb3-type cytochrome oxidase maturation protein|uniref:Cytochrome oxidase maturation protein, cbb3-type n=2 Tax=Thalassovita taeanensis TaxID=657014 RepID=A0A1H9KG27_9RHOB|nr:cytochrome oxidase maturation protein, cbb3-type [Thalassovita taeanensis]
MTALLVLIPVSIGMGLIGLGAFIWATRHQQFDDLEGNAWRVIGQMETEDEKGKPDD